MEVLTTADKPLVALKDFLGIEDLPDVLNAADIPRFEDDPSEQDANFAVISAFAKGVLFGRER